ncbi:hypothetical protein, partial [Vibrio parahaemolyticus]|uniref:hypothetical protein n=1 Tax=Vibrio parahaemolyticus TaxID=670 RepID=UPI00116D1C87
EADSIVKTKFENYKSELVKLGIDLPSFDGVEQDNIKDQVELVLKNKLYLLDKEIHAKIQEQEHLKREIAKFSLTYKGSLNNIKKLIKDKENVVELKQHYDLYQVKNKKLTDEKRNLEKQIQSLYLTKDYNEKISSYIVTKRIVMSFFNENRTQKQKLLEIASSTSNLNKLIENSNEQLGSIFSYIDALDNKKKNLDDLYIDFNEIKVERTLLIKAIETKKKESSILKSDIDKFKFSISKLRNIPFDNGAWELELESLNLISKEDYRQVAELKDTLRLIEV